MKDNLTPLERGIFVKIDEIQLELLKQKPGFMSKEAYPEKYTEICVKDEIGRFLFFRFLKECD